ncbi:transposase, partial [Staphylococcus aureus]
RSYPYDSKYTTQTWGIIICWLFKRKSNLMIFDRHANLKYRYGNRKFWCKGFYVDTVGRNKKVIENYIRNQLQEDIVADEISMEEYLDPFTGEKNKKRKKKE